MTTQSTQRLVAAGVLLLVCVIAARALAARQENASSIVGVWRVAEVTYTGPNARKITTPQPGFRIFTQRHYSTNVVTSDMPRAGLPPQGQAATDKQLADAFGPFTAQAGTYELRGNELNTRPLAAKNPNVMQAGNFNTFTVTLSGNSLTLVGKASQTGPVINPTTTRYTRVE